MRTSVKLGAFVVAAGAVFGTAYGVGSAVDPIAEDSVDSAADDHGGMVMGTGTGAAEPGGEAAPAGLAVSDRGYTLRLQDPTPGRGRHVQVAFDVAGPDGDAVRSYAIAHEKPMHLIVVRRDLTGFQHVHPEMDAHGRWNAAVDLAKPGAYRLFADFVPAALAQPVTLGADLFVPGADFAPAELPEPAATWSHDGFEVTLGGAPRAGSEAALTFTVRRDDVPVTDLEPYLGAFGHLVSLRAGDLAYLHTHPAEEAAAGASGGPDIRFATTFPTAGRYRLCLNFRHDGVVRTAEFTVEVPPGGTAATRSGHQTAPTDAGHPGH